MSQSGNNVEATYPQRKIVTSEWEYLISISGGFLAPDKIAWYLINYKWRQGKWKFTNLVQEKVMEANNKAGEKSPLVIS